MSLARHSHDLTTTPQHSTATLDHTGGSRHDTHSTPVPERRGCGWLDRTQVFNMEAERHTNHRHVTQRATNPNCRTTTQEPFTRTRLPVATGTAKDDAGEVHVGKVEPDVGTEDQTDGDAKTILSCGKHGFKKTSQKLLSTSTERLDRHPVLFLGESCVSRPVRRNSLNATGSVHRTTSPDAHTRTFFSCEHHSVSSAHFQCGHTTLAQGKLSRAHLVP